MKSRLRLLLKDMRIITYIALCTVLVAAFQNCGELKSNSANSGSNQGLAVTPLDDADIEFSKTELVLTETTTGAASDVIAISLKKGSASARFNFKLVQLENNGQPTEQTVLGALDGSATLTEAFTSSEVRLVSGSNAMLIDAKNKTLFLIVNKEEPTANQFVIPVRIVLTSNPNPPPVDPEDPPPPPPPPRVVTPDNATGTEREIECRKYSTQAPSFSNVFNDSVVNIGFGNSNANDAGVAIEGNQVFPGIGFSISRNVSDVANYNLWRCNEVVTTRLRTEVVTGETNNNARSAPSFTSAMDVNGVAIDLSTPANINQLAGELYAINNQNNNANRFTFAANVNSATLTFNPRYTGGNNRTQKCVGGSVWLRVTVALVDIGQNANNNNPRSASHVSAPQYIRLNVINNCWTEHRLRNPGNTNYAEQIALGTDVAVSGNWAAVLAETDSISASQQNTGAIYMFKKENGVWVRKGNRVVINEALTGQQITSIDLKGDILIAGVPKRNRGTVYVFKRTDDTWNLVQSIPSAFPSGSPEFGRGLAMSSTQIAVGAPFANRVYLYNYNSTTGDVNSVPETINGEDRTAYHISMSYFGGSLLFHGPHLFVGAPMAKGISIPDDAENRMAAVHIYNVSTGSPVFFKTMVGHQEGDRFGVNFAAHGNRLAIASGNYKNNGVAVGRVDYYNDYRVIVPDNDDPDSEPQQLVSNRNWIGPIEKSEIGNGLAMTANGLFIGTPKDDQPGNAGQVNYYPFDAGQASGFGNRTRIRATNQEDNSFFGGAMAIDGNNLIIGAKNKKDGVTDSGAAFIYEAR